MPLEFIDLNSPPVVAVNRDKRKAMGKKNGTKQGLKNPQKKIVQCLKKKTSQNGNQILNQQIAT